MMKNFATLSWQVDENTYREDSALSYSTISKFSKEGFSGIPHLYDKVESPSLLFGSMVDTLLTKGIREFEDTYIACDFPEISDTLTNIAKSLYELYKDTYNKFEDIPDELLASTGLAHNYYVSSEKTRVSNIKKSCGVYYNTLIECGDKIIVNQQDYYDAIACRDTLKVNNATAQYFADNDPFDVETDIFYQLKFKGEYEGIPIKCMLDVVKVDHVAKVIIPCDLKTTSSPEYEFHKSFLKWNYYIQAQMYWYILNEAIKKDEFYKDYEVLPFRFIVINRKNLNPLVWNYNFSTAPLEKNMHVPHDWTKLVKELYYYLNNDVKVPIGITHFNSLDEWLNLM